MADNKVFENAEKSENVEDMPEVLGNAIGKDSMYVKLVSKDGREFYIERNYAVKSGTFKSMLQFTDQDCEDGSTSLDCSVVPSHILDLVANFLMFKTHYASSSSPPEYDQNIDRQTAVELLLAGHYFDC